MNDNKNIKTTTGSFAKQTSSAKVVVLTQMDSLTKSSTASLRRDMAESVRKDVQVLKKFGLITTD